MVMFSGCHGVRDEYFVGSPGSSSLILAKISNIDHALSFTENSIGKELSSISLACRRGGSPACVLHKCISAGKGKDKTI